MLVRGHRVARDVSHPLTMSANRTIWYELHAREWPFKTQPAEAIIWQMGTGMKPNLSQIGMGKEISVSPGIVPGLGDEGRSRHNSGPSFSCMLIRLQTLSWRVTESLRTDSAGDHVELRRQSF